MTFLKRIASGALLWLMLTGAVVACGGATALWPDVRPRPDAALPIRGYPPEVLGPSVEQAIELMSRNGPQWACPTDVVE